MTLPAQEPDESTRTVRELLAGYARTLAELRGRGIVRSNNAPAGDYAEWLVWKALGGKLAEKPSEKSWDVSLPSGKRVQVKARVTSVLLHAGQLQTSPFRSWNFDFAAFVLLAADDYRVTRAALVPVAVVRVVARRRPHVNGDIVMMNTALLGHPEATDLTDAPESGGGARLREGGQSGANGSAERGWPRLLQTNYAGGCVGRPDRRPSRPVGNTARKSWRREAMSTVCPAASSSIS